MAKTIEKKDKRLKGLISELKTLNKTLDELIEENSEVFDQYRELEEGIARVTDSLKQEARLFIHEGDPTLVLYDDASLHVSVVQRPRPVSYDYEKARKYFPKEVFLSCRAKELDAKVVESYITREEIEEDIAEKVRVEGALPTAAVTIKVIK